jgi:hypothetical protein
MKARWLSTFNLIGLALIALGIVGLCLGHKFVYDPGQIADGHEPWYYIAVGVLLIVNGLVNQRDEESPEVSPPGKPEQKRPRSRFTSDARRSADATRSALVGAAAKERPEQAEP